MKISLLLTDIDILKIDKNIKFEIFEDVTLFDEYTTDILEIGKHVELTADENTLINWLKTFKTVWLYIGIHEYIEYHINDESIKNLYLN